MSSQHESIEPRAMGSPKSSSYNGRTVGLDSKEAILSAPLYRIIAESTTHNVVRTEDSHIHKILRNPGNVRRTGFGFIGVKRIDPSPEGIKGADAWGYEVELSRNGSLGLRCPLSNTQFQWYKQESGIPSHSNWLYPYGVCEYPVTFMRLVKEIYQSGWHYVENSCQTGISQSQRIPLGGTPSTQSAFRKTGSRAACIQFV